MIKAVTHFTYILMNKASRALLIILLGGALATITNTSLAVIEDYNFPNTEMEQRYRDLIEEFRCLVCQNQNIADSDAGLAKDLRRKTREMIMAGDSDKQIRNYMRERYGDFVLYSPPFEARNALLWLAPFLFLSATLITVFWNIHRKRIASEQMRADAQGVSQSASLTRARELLRDDRPHRGN